MDLKIPDMVKGSLVSPNIFHVKNVLNGRTAFTTNFHPRKTIIVFPYHISSKKGSPILDDGDNRYVKTIYQVSVVGNMFTIDSRKVLNILKEITLGTDTKKWIKGLKCG